MDGSAAFHGSAPRESNVVVRGHHSSCASPRSVTARGRRHSGSIASESGVRAVDAVRRGSRERDGPTGEMHTRTKERRGWQRREQWSDRHGAEDERSGGAFWGTESHSYTGNSIVLTAIGCGEAHRRRTDVADSAETVQHGRKESRTTEAQRKVISVTSDSAPVAMSILWLHACACAVFVRGDASAAGEAKNAREMLRPRTAPCCVHC